MITSSPSSNEDAEPETNEQLIVKYPSFSDTDDIVNNAKSSALILLEILK
jgi:hypothetical protein